MFLNICAFVLFCFFGLDCVIIICSEENQACYEVCVCVCVCVCVDKYNKILNFIYNLYPLSCLFTRSMIFDHVWYSWSEIYRNWKKMHVQNEMFPFCYM